MTVVLSAATIAAALGQFPPTIEQTAVIEAPLAPALVVAGAGSGKTETMAGRVVWLVANGLVRRDEVLGLTFTRKAAGELAERIQRRLQRLSEFETRGLLGALPALHEAGRLAVFAELTRAEGARADAARLEVLDALAAEVGADDPGLDDGDQLLHRPTVSTYNSFADSIVREHGLRIGRDSEAAVLSESAAWLLMRRVVFTSDDPRLEERQESPRTLIDAALRIARDGVDNLVDLDELAAFPDEFARIVERPSTSARVTVYKEVADAASRVSALSLLARLAADYDREKARLGVMDFADQVAGALRIAQEHPAVVEELRARYRVVLLDEYQDTSVVQTDLLATLFGGTGVMAVGDPHQAIYAWRGASAGNLGGFPDAFAPEGGCQRFALLTSWRNSARVLDAANAVLAPLAHRAAVAVEELRSRPGAPEGVVEIAFENDLDAEADRVASWFVGIRAARAAEGRGTTGAVLFRSKKHMVRFGDALGRRGIPHRILGLGGLLTTPEVVDVVSVLRVISDPEAGSALIRLLSGPRWAVGFGRSARPRSSREAASDTRRRPATARPRGRGPPALDAGGRSRVAGRRSRFRHPPDRRPRVADRHHSRRPCAPPGSRCGVRSPPQERRCPDPRAHPPHRGRAASRHRTRRERGTRPCSYRLGAVARFRRRDPRVPGGGRVRLRLEPVGVARSRRAGRRVRAAYRAARGRRRPAPHDPRFEGPGVGCRGRRAPRDRRIALASA
ncbi:superfamily I DNA/RNA helicase [Microbacterium testaceum]|nr:superfamily I DNA/RNA helicase [Microbacterium testaceum]